MLDIGIICRCDEAQDLLDMGYRPVCRDSFMDGKAYVNGKRTLAQQRPKFSIK
jgi:hypothetical protein